MTDIELPSLVTQVSPSQIETELAPSTSAEVAEYKKKRLLPNYIRKWRGIATIAGTATDKPKVPLSLLAKDASMSFLGSFIGIMVPAVLNQYVLDEIHYTLLIGSFGATAVLLYCAFQSPLAQPRNVVGGHVISAFVGVCMRKAFGDHLTFLAAALSVSLAIVLMTVTRTIHPPGGATALIAVTGGPLIYNLSWLYIVFPVLTGIVIMLLVALVVNNADNARQYPHHWW
eukprot:Colp12_sorted_trinity150504_noHs@16170